MWLICQLEFNGRKQELMHPKRYTQLFFLDEAVALAAGHRPCGECRRKNYRAYVEAANGRSEDPISGASNLDKALSDSRRASRTPSAIASLPDGVFISLGDNDLAWAITTSDSFGPVRYTGGRRKATAIGSQLQMSVSRRRLY